MFDKKIIMGIVIGFCLGVSSLALTRPQTQQEFLNWANSVNWNGNTDVDDLNVKEMQQVIRRAIEGCEITGPEVYGIHQLKLNCDYQ